MRVIVELLTVCQGYKSFRATEYSISYPSSIAGSVWICTVEFSTLIQFTRLVADSPTSESVSSLLAETVVQKCGVLHALAFGTDASGDFKVLASYGNCKLELSLLDLNGVDSLTAGLLYTSDAADER